MHPTEATRLIEVPDGSSGNGDSSSAASSTTEGSGKNIGMLGSIAIAVNSLAGPAVLQLPFQYQQSGLIPTTLCLILVAVLSAYCCLHAANTVSLVPRNKNFDQCIEFSDPYRIFWSPMAYQVTQVLFYLTAVCLNIASIIDTAQVADSIIGLHTTSYGLSIDRGELQAWSHLGPCTLRQSKLLLCDPFQNEQLYGNYLLTLGYLLTAAVFVPVCLKDLKENTNWQIFGFAILVSLSLYFCYSFGESGKMSLRHASLWGHEWSSMLGVIMFNFALVLAIPAWLHEKKDNVSVVQTVVYSTAIATALYIGVGALGALAISHVHVNLLTPMVSGAYGEGVQVTASIFAFFIIGLDIPLFSVLTRYNLTHSGLCSTRTANLLVVWIPWGLAWLFYQGDAIGSLLDWSGTILTSTLAFLLPLYLALRALKSQSDSDKGSVAVYGKWRALQSRSAQIMSLYVLLTIAAIGVLWAIGGQLYWAVLKEEDFLLSEEYLADNETATARTAAALNLH